MTDETGHLGQGRSAGYPELRRARAPTRSARARAATATPTTGPTDGPASASLRPVRREPAARGLHRPRSRCAWRGTLLRQHSSESILPPRLRPREPHGALRGRLILPARSRYVEALTSPTVTDVEREERAEPHLLERSTPRTGDGPTVRDPRARLLRRRHRRALAAHRPPEERPARSDRRRQRRRRDAGGRLQVVKAYSVVDAAGHSAWDYIMGDPETYVARSHPS